MSQSPFIQPKGGFPKNFGELLLDKGILPVAMVALQLDSGEFLVTRSRKTRNEGDGTNSAITGLPLLSLGQDISTKQAHRRLTNKYYGFSRVYQLDDVLLADRISVIPVETNGMIDEAFPDFRRIAFVPFVGRASLKKTATDSKLIATDDTELVSASAPWIISSFKLADKKYGYKFQLEHKKVTTSLLHSLAPELI